MNDLRPLSVGEVLDVAFKLYGRHWARFAATIAVVVVPVQLIDAAIRLSTIDHLNGNKIFYSDRTAYSAGQVAIAALTLVITLFVTAAAFRAVTQAYMGHNPSIGGSLGFALRRTHSLLWLYLLLFIGLVLGFIALVVPFIYLWAAWSVAVPVLMVEGVKGSKALRRSRALVRGRWWQVFAVLIVSAVIIQFTTSLAIGVLGAVIINQSDSLTVYVLVNGVIGGIVEILVAPITVAVTTVLYYDLRVRKEGFDLSLMIDALGLPAGDPGSGPAPAGIAGLPPPPPPAARPAPQTRWEPPVAGPSGTLPAGWAPPVAPDPIAPDPTTDPFGAG